MAWSQEISQLVTEVDQLTAAVNVKKTVLENAANTAVVAANDATTSAAASATSAGQAAGSAAQALAIYGSVEAQQTAVATAQAQASLAAGFAASAASVVQQDLSGITAQALHRSPNAITAMFIYDTSKDSDGGAWTEKCQHTSWWNEAINGKWLGAQASEFNARHEGATVGAELLTNNSFDLTTSWSTSTLSIGGGVASLIAASQVSLSQAIAITAGRLYRVVLNIRSHAGGSMWVRFTGGTAVNSAVFSGAGRHVFYLTATTGNNNLLLEASGAAQQTALVIEDISVREVTSITTASGDYYQSTTDGRFYRLWKNMLSFSTPQNVTAWTGNTSDFGATTAVTFGAAGAVFDGSASKLARTLGGLPGFAAALSFTVKSVSNLTVTFSYRNPSVGNAVITYNPTTKTASIASGSQFSAPVVQTISADTARVILPFAVLTGVNCQFMLTGGGAGDAFYDFQWEPGSSFTSFEAKGADGSITEVFRGNKRDFPRLAGIVAEAGNVTIYDLTEPGRPMWMRFAQIASNWSMIGIVGQSVSSVAALNSRMVVGCSGTSGSLHEIDFGGEAPVTVRITTNSNYLTGFIANRITATTLLGGAGSVTSIVNRTVNAVAMTVLPDAPVDPVTGLRVPTIAVATAGGVSVIQHSGTVRNSSSTSSFDTIALTPSMISAGRADGIWYTAANPGALGVSFALAQRTAAQAPGFSIGNTGKLVDMGRSRLLRRSTTAARAQMARAHESDAARSLIATVADTFNTGWMAGDIRRCFLSDTEVGSVGPELVTNGDFSNGTTGWTLSAGWAWDAGVVRRVTGQDPSGAVLSPVSGFIQAGKSYQVKWTRAGAAFNGIKVRAYTDAAGGGTLFYNPNYQDGLGEQSHIFTATQNGWVALWCLVDSNVITIDNISVREVIPDRSYKAAGADITGTLTRAQLASGTSLVGYSGWSAVNYLREPYSADLDFGTGEWTASAWVNVPQARRNLLSYTEDFSNAAWVKSNTSVAPNTTPNLLYVAKSSTVGCLISQNFAGMVAAGVYTATWIVEPSGFDWVVIAIRNIAANRSYWQWVNIVTGDVGASTSLSYTRDDILVVPDGDGRLRISLSVNVTPETGLGTALAIADGNGSFTATANGTSGVLTFGAQLELGSTATPYQPVVTGSEILGTIFDRAAPSGPRLRLAMNGLGQLTAEAFDGTTTRTVTTSAAYNTATWLKARVNYTTDGTLAIIVNGREVAASRGTPLLTLNNASAVLTIGNSFALDAPFPGSIALLKLGATVPTPEQATFMFEQEKQLFRAGALSVLPDSGAIVDMAYDDATDRWVAISAANESYWTGLVRNSVTPVPAGSYTRVTTTSGIELTARSTTKPGVDITVPPYGLREELVKRAEAAARLSRLIATYDYVGGFTGNITTGSTAIASVTNLTYPTSYIGARISGAGIPVNAFITGVSGTTIYISAPASATTTGVSISFLDFILPVGQEAKVVMSAGTARREGPTADYIRLYDGFKETIRFGSAPGATTWVQIQSIGVSQ